MRARAVILPARDEEGAIEGVLRRIPAGWRVIVVDNGSVDATARLAAQAGATVLTEPLAGYGRAVQAGLRQLAEDPPAVVAVLDADGSDDPERLTDLSAPILADQADLVLSDRTRTAVPGALTLPQRWGNQLATSLIYWRSGVRYRDMGPMRAFRWSAVESLQLVDPTWGWNVEIQLKAARHGLRVLEIPLPYRRRAAGQSKISGTVVGVARAGVRILQAVGRYDRVY